ncbi:MAG: 2Fe-2S iron-sulfur cluster binding domain-containing protein [Chloroflexi bacterium]|nr:2Fe-2S iron-sulfur cluster binding domain-containing protein [Chloroflexota bacterium]
MPISLIINNKAITAPEGATILEAAHSAGIDIPTLCHHPDLGDVGACRMCVVSVQGARALQTACTAPAAEGMVVDTMSAEAVESRRFVLEMLLTDHPNDCMGCEVAGDCDLQDLVYDYQVEWPEHNGDRHQYEINPDPNPFILIDRNKCILCSRCIRACSEIQNRDVWSFAYRGFKSKLVAGADQMLIEAGCETCGQCVAYCPVGALQDKMSLGLGRANQVKKVRTTCSYCGVGCQFDLNVRNNKIVRVTSSEDAPVNGMALCVKGRYGYDYVHHPDRLTRPLVRAKWLGLEAVAEEVNGGRWSVVSEAQQRLVGHGHQPTSGNGTQHATRNTQHVVSSDTYIETDWDTALDVVANKFTEEKKAHGGDAFALLASAKCTNEENFIFNKFTRQMLATHSIDHCARL